MVAHLLVSGILGERKSQQNMTGWEGHSSRGEKTGLSVLDGSQSFVADSTPAPA